MKTITSIENPRFRSLLRLAQSARERRTAGKSLLDGTHLVATYAEHMGSPAEIALSPEGAENPEISRLLEKCGAARVMVYSDALFRQLSSVATPTGIIAVVPTPKADTPSTLDGPGVWLEDIQDPGNVGSILRSAAAAGVSTVCLSKHSVHAWSPRVLRAGMGAHFVLRIVEGVDLRSLAKVYAGRIIATCVSAGKTIYDTDLGGDVALLFGNEGAGLSQELLALAHETVCIPMPGRTESLNVGAAAAACLFERVRQLRSQ
ncbi:MAG: RNA methyltransferase [Betaproteobacteria bacterium]|jgi:TrmH family RNA methyltransferase|nr:RNA methyltransferase [Betaproteobacteria bacterium]MDH4292852.1 RNA methyltransferase [Betaproteobacteria bacterium]MDH5342225.1 RNA methyltransferase [Betaproteobacteria bacterium]